MSPAFWNNLSARQIERASIRSFMEKNRHHLKGRVLDFGAGKVGTCQQPQPYRDLVSGEYFPYDKGDQMPVGRFDAVMCNQVLQFLPNTQAFLHDMAIRLKPGGVIVMTYPTTWPEVEDADIFRFTKCGIERMIRNVGMAVLEHECRAEINLDGFRLALGYGIVARRTTPRNKLTPDESAELLTEKIINREPFFFVRYGDGAIECIYGLGNGQTRDHEQYSSEMGSELKHCWDALMRSNRTYVGDWFSASFLENGEDQFTEYATEYSQMIGDANPNWIHFEALLVMRESKALVDFYRAVKRDDRRKLYMGPKHLAPTAHMLGAYKHIVTPMKDLFKEVDQLTEILMKEEFDILLYGAGMAGNIPAIRVWEAFPDRTFVNLGSAMDILFGQRTRKQQLPKAIARRMFAGLF